MLFLLVMFIKNSNRYCEATFEFFQLFCSHEVNYKHIENYTQTNKCKKSERKREPSLLFRGGAGTILPQCVLYRKIFK